MIVVESLSRSAGVDDSARRIGESRAVCSVT
jgi:hypothetical protein